MKFRITEHAKKEITRRQIPESALQEVLDNPEQVLPEESGRKAYQSRLDFGGKMYLVRAIVEDDIKPAVVVTVYRTSKIAKYWRIR
ncbi:MAG TPA: DUF4258 domain-containing protein [Armatimonadota bacterium]|nr:DUF4258 domain-containing protein [Armatimonadota bacterium]